MLGTSFAIAEVVSNHIGDTLLAQRQSPVPDIRQPAAFQIVLDYSEKLWLGRKVSLETHTNFVSRLAD